MVVRACLFASIGIVSSKKLNLKVVTQMNLQDIVVAKIVKNGVSVAAIVYPYQPHLHTVGTVLARRTPRAGSPATKYRLVLLSNGMALPVNIAASRSTTDITMIGIRLDIVKLAQALIRAVILKFLEHSRTWLSRL